MRIISWNVNGLRAVLKKNFCEFVKEHSPDILCLQETKVSADICGDLELPFKYKNFSCAEKKGYSGTAILSNIEPLDARAIELEGHPCEGRIVCANFGEINLASVYVPNSQDGLKRLAYRRRWNRDFAEFAKGMPNAVICGDMNVAHCEIDIARPDTNHFSAGFTDEERGDFTMLLNEASLSDVWRERNPALADKYTWWSYRFGARQKNIGWRIDYFLVRNSLSKKVKKAEILDKVEGSDHCPVMIEL
ncbi:MAG: exodeoxyribonuclease III [Opitutales bacterium]|nr:exodeoxyribonuclease III [Opitutales bacterium]